MFTSIPTAPRRRVTWLLALATGLCALNLMAPVRAQISATNRGYYSSNNGVTNGANANYLTGALGGNAYRSYFVFNIPALMGGQTYTGVTFSLNIVGGQALASADSLSLRDYAGNISALGGSSNATNIYADLGSGSDYGSVSLFGVASNSTVNVTFSSAALADLNAAAGSQFAFGANIFNPSTGSTIIGNGSGGTTVTNAQLTLTTNGGAVAPEPGSVAFALLGGVGVVGSMVRRKWAG